MTATVKTPRKVAVVRASRGGTAPAARMIPRVVSPFAVASTMPGFSSSRTAAAAPRSL